MPPVPPAIALAQVTVTFRLADGGAYPAVERASLAVADGEFVSIVGPTGCGKSTLLNVAAGLIAPSSGRIDIFGGPLGKVAGAIALPGIRRFRSRFDYDPYVSAPLLGVAGISVVTHGRARASMMRRAIEVAERAVDTRLVAVIAEIPTRNAA
jgi:energy-coupling factor transporter ATP-binding protein EcfA2